jgi:N-acetylmuramoyl-L-alanine amidase
VCTVRAFMKRVALWFCLAGWLTLRGQHGRLETVSWFGHDYVRLADWARAHGFESAWSRRDEELEVTSRWTKLVFVVDSNRASINGVIVFLSAPIAARNGVAYIAKVDLDSAIHPVLFPPRNRGGAPVMSICLDPGHGGRDPGNEEARWKEKEYTLGLAWEVRRLLAKSGMTVHLTRSTDTFVALPDRPDLAKRRGDDLFVSLHFNAAITDKRTVRGVEVYCMTPAGESSTNARGEGAEEAASKGNLDDARNMLLAYHIQKSLVGNLKVEDRGVRRARFAVLRNAEMPAVLVEAGFMSHPEESLKIRSAGYRAELAQAIVDGILAYKRQVERTN